MILRSMRNPNDVRADQDNGIFQYLVNISQERMVMHTPGFHSRRERSEMLFEQEQEITTIKKRKFILELSDEGVDRLFAMAASVGMYPDRLLERFVGDLTEDTYSHGSDERTLAEQWFERCGFSFLPEKTFLNYLGDRWWMFKSVMENLQTIKKDEAVIRKYQEELESGSIKGRGQTYTWKDITSEKKPVYKSREAWERDVKADIQAYQEEIKQLQEEIKSDWELYRKWTEEETGTFEEAMQELIKWEEHYSRTQEECGEEKEQKEEEIREEEPREEENRKPQGRKTR